jgi:hypothetical protein
MRSLQILLQNLSRMPDIHNEECKKHRCCIEGVYKELVMVDINVHFCALGGGKFDDAEDDSVLKVNLEQVERIQRQRRL